MQISSSGGYVNFVFLKITAPTVFHQRFEPGTRGSESHCAKLGPVFQSLEQCIQW